MFQGMYRALPQYLIRKTSKWGLDAVSSPCKWRRMFDASAVPLCSLAVKPADIESHSPPPLDSNDRAKSEEPLRPPYADGEERVYSKEIESLAERICGLSLLEVTDLNSLLKKKLNLPDVPMMAAGAMMAMPSGPKEEAHADEIVQTKSAFTVKLLGFEPDKKIALIKEVKNVVQGMNLVQAKKFVESVPQVLLDNIGKDEADKLAKTLTELGGKCEIV